MSRLSIFCSPETLSDELKLCLVRKTRGKVILILSENKLIIHICEDFYAMFLCIVNSFELSGLFGSKVSAGEKMF